MNRLLLSCIVFMVSIAVVHAQQETIEFASSHYQTSSGVISPNENIAVHYFELDIKTSRTLVLDKLIISSYVLSGQNLVMPPINDRLKLKVEITISQGNAFEYSAKLTFNDVTVPMEVIRKRRDISVEPAIILEVGYSLDQSDLHQVIKKEFDSSSEVYNN